MRRSKALAGLMILATTFRSSTEQMKVERTRWKKMERQRPSYRVELAMKRLSRNQYLTPQEVDFIGMALARIASPSQWASVFRAVIGHHYFTGMINGEPAFYVYERGYKDALKVVSQEKDKTKILIQFLKIKEKVK